MPTHREVKSPQISVRYLADYMAASERSRRTIVRGCKYQPIARVVQHDEAKMALSRFLCSNGRDLNVLTDKAQSLRDRMADSEFDRDVLDHNADYIDQFASVFPEIELPEAEISAAGKSPFETLEGTKLKSEIHFRLRRSTRTNKVRIGIGSFRYAKSKPLSAAVGEWQSAILFGLLGLTNVEDNADPELKLCLTIDAQSGVVYSAPSNSVSRFKNAEAACADIAERWPNIVPPPGAVL